MLASVADVQSLGVTAPEGKIVASLAKASARFRQEARHHISVQSYDRVLRQWGARVQIPVTPVLSVDAVRLIELDGSDGLNVLGYYFDAIDTITLGDDFPIINGPGIVTATVRVQFTAGFDPIPEDVRWCVASMVERALTAAAPGIASETIADYTWRGGSYTASGALSMSRDELAIAHSYRRRSGTVNLSQG